MFTYSVIKINLKNVCVKWKEFKIFIENLIKISILFFYKREVCVYGRTLSAKIVFYVK